MSDEQKSAEVLDAIEQEARNEAQAREEYCFLFGHYYKEEDFWDWYYREFNK